MSVFTKALITVGAVAVLLPVAEAWRQVARSAAGAVGKELSGWAWDRYVARKAARRAAGVEGDTVGSGSSW